jgi:hypothetical protein
VRTVLAIGEQGAHGLGDQIDHGFNGVILQRASVLGDDGGFQVGEGGGDVSFSKLETDDESAARVEGQEDGPPPPTGISGFFLEDQT